MENSFRGENIFSASDDVAEEFKQWLLMDSWPYESAMWLLAGVIPHEIYEGMGFFTTSGNLLHNDKGERDEKIHQIGNLKRLWLSNPSNPERAGPSVYLAWAAEKNIDVYWLDSARKEGYLLPSEKRSTTEEKPLGTTERKTLLTIIAALAKEAKINIDQPGKAAGFIAGLTDSMGAAVSKRAIEDHLKKIPDALETRMK